MKGIDLKTEVRGGGDEDEKDQTCYLSWISLGMVKARTFVIKVAKFELVPHPNHSKRDVTSTIFMPKRIKLKVV